MQKIRKKKHSQRKKGLWDFNRFFRFPRNMSGGIDIVIFCYIILLILFGSVMVFSASTAYASIRFNDSYYFVRRQIIWVLIGLLAMAISASAPMDFYKRASRPLFIVTLVLLALVPLLGAEAGGAKRWIAIGSFTFQPSELAKTSLVLMLAYYFSNHMKEVKDKKRKGKSFLYGIFYPLLFIGGVCGLVVLEKHLSCIIIVGAIGVLMMFLAGSNAKTLGLMGAGAVAGVGVFALAVEYTRRRITIWLNPELYPRDGGWQTLQGLMAIGSGGFFGLGLGNSRLKYLYVSEPQNDFIFTIACEELGFLGAFAILALFTLFVKRGVHIALHHPDTFSSLVAVGISLKVAIQVILNIAVITNTIPNTGISLPFFSYGGSSLVMLFAEMGILLSASKDAYIKR
ncbi:MAG: cell division protein FtsW [Clostridia bacterium]|nr:cell division protein FtsW [Clostridia bacterium]